MRRIIMFVVVFLGCRLRTALLIVLLLILLVLMTFMLNSALTVFLVQRFYQSRRFLVHIVLFESFSLVDSLSAV